MGPISSVVQQEKIRGVINMEFVLTKGKLVNELNYLAKGMRHYRLSSILISPPPSPNPKSTD